MMRVKLSASHIKARLGSQNEVTQAALTLNCVRSIKVNTMPRTL